MTSPLITLTTDFGTSDGADAAVKGVILDRCPDARIIDVTHTIPPHTIEPALFVTGNVWPLFPPGTIHVCIVDPGVGTARKGLLLLTELGVFIGPDNGVLSAALPDDVRALAGAAPSTVALPPNVIAYALENPDYRREPMSATFHGRDMFAPAAAHVALGAAPETFGPRLDRIMVFPLFHAVEESNGTIIARVIYIDRFGNTITNVRARDLPKAFTVEIGGWNVAGPTATFHAGGGPLVALIDSSGYLAIAAPSASAAALLRVRPGDPVRVLPAG